MFITYRESIPPFTKKNLNKLNFLSYINNLTLS